MRRRTTNVNEVKTSLNNYEYQKLQGYKAVFDVQTDADAVRRLVRQSLCGMVPNLPPDLLHVSEEVGQVGQRMAA